MVRDDQDKIIDQVLGELQAPIMRFIWARGSVSVRDVLLALNADGRNLAYTTVMTVMSRLAERGVLSRERQGKMHVYRPTATRDGFLRQTAAQRVEELLTEFGDLAVAQFLAEVTDISPERRRQLKRLIDQDPDS